MKINYSETKVFMQRMKWKTSGMHPS